MQAREGNILQHYHRNRIGATWGNQVRIIIWGAMEPLWDQPRGLVQCPCSCRTFGRTSVFVCAAAISHFLFADLLPIASMRARWADVQDPGSNFHSGAAPLSLLVVLAVASSQYRWKTSSPCGRAMRSNRGRVTKTPSRSSNLGHQLLMKTV